MNVRIATVDDAESISLLHATSWQRTYRGIYRDEFLDGDVIENRRSVWTQRLFQARNNQHVLVAIEGDELLGFACVYGGEDAKWGSMLDNLHVRAERQGRGVGRELIGRAAVWSRDNYPAAKFFLWVFANNVAARGFYESLGATNSESVEAPIPGGGTAMECRYTWADIGALIRASGRASAETR